jgi:hypothetical protein
VTTQPPIGTQFLGGSIPLMGGPNSPLGKNIPPALAQYWTQLLQNLAHNPGGQQTIPTQGQPYPGVTNPIWGSVSVYSTPGLYSDSRSKSLGLLPYYTTIRATGIFSLGENCIRTYWFTDGASTPKSPVPPGESAITFSCHFGFAGSCLGF